MNMPSKDFLSINNQDEFLVDNNNDKHTCSIEEGCDGEKKEHWKFLASFYFIVTSLTSIG